jgi:hypothetical protein
MFGKVTIWKFKLWLDPIRAEVVRITSDVKAVNRPGKIRSNE